MGQDIMYIQKWEMRFSLLLLLLLLNMFLLVHGQNTCNTNGAGSDECQQAGGFVQMVDSSGTCVSSACFTEEMKNIYANLSDPKNMNTELTPKISRSGKFPNQVGKPFNLTCMAWGLRAKGLKGVDIASPSVPALPEAIRSKIHLLNGQTITAVALKTTMKIELTGNRHRQNLTCSMTFESSSTASADEKKRVARDRLYAFKQTEPVVRGPTKTEAGTTYTWECVVAEVTVDNQTQLRVTLSTMPLGSQAPEEQENIQSLESTNPLKLKVTKTMMFAVPPSFRPAFFVQCRAENRALGSGQTVAMYSEILRVKVETKPYELSGIFTIVGVSFGLGGFALGSALVIFYWKKAKAAKAAEGK